MFKNNDQDRCAVKVIHDKVSGRMRLSIRGLVKSHKFKIHLESNLAEKREITKFNISILTGNILVFYDSSYNSDTVVMVIEKVVMEFMGESYNEVECSRQSADFGNTPKKEGPSKSKKERKKNKRKKLKASEALAIFNKEQESKPWHTIAVDKILAFFGSSKERGLADEQAIAYLQDYGPNLLPDAEPRSPLTIFLGQFTSLPVYLLGIAAGVSLFTGGAVDAIVIMAVVGINGVIGFFTEAQAEKTINSLKSLVRPHAFLFREQRAIESRCEDVVPGDILLLKPGTFVAADARIIDSHYLSVDESALTGESLPVGKNANVIEEVDIPVADRNNMVYMGTMVTGGQGLACVVSTGQYTEIGQIQSLSAEAGSPKTPLENQLDVVGNQLVYISSAICALVFGIGLIRGYGFLQMLNMALSLAVAAVPEGLPAVATTTLALGIKKLKTHNILVRTLEAVEVLGSCQTICFDKTGTITYNRMTVVSIYVSSMPVDVSGKELTIEGQSLDINAVSELRNLVEVGVLCNETEVSKKEGQCVLMGSPTEMALVQTAIDSDLDVFALRDGLPILKINHRTEAHNYMSMVHDCSAADNEYITKYPSPNQSKKFVSLKGSPIEVLSMCEFVLKNGEVIPIYNELRDIVENENEKMAANALRILGMAYCYLNDEEDNLPETPKGLIWLGLVGMIDPIREGMEVLIESFHKAGIDTIMITGDQSLTAYAIGKQLNISGDENIEIVDSRHLKNLDDNVLKTLCERVHVFSRVSPAHKYEIVKALQDSGKVVAMTGDGINDAPALKAANIGISIGQGGTDLAREVADVILEENDLHTMLDAVSHGRTIYNNIRKSVRFLLSTNLSEIAVMFTTLSTGLGHPLNTMQLLWINLVSDIFPGLALSLEPAEANVLSRPPRDPSEQILEPSDLKKLAIESSIISASTIGTYGYGISRYGMSPRANTLAFISLTLGQLIHTYSCRSEDISIYDRKRLQKNKLLDLAMIGSFSSQLLCMLVPGLRNLLGITTINVSDSLVILGSAVLPFLVNEGIKHKGVIK